MQMSCMNGSKSFTYDKSFEPKLNEVAARGNQAVFRIYLDYPGEKPGIRLSLEVRADRLVGSVECHGILGKQESGHQGCRQELSKGDV